MKEKSKYYDFSIIVPIYNVAIFLRKCIESIINQTYKNFELILVDDGSTDESSEICDEYKEKYNNIVVIHKKNGGLVSARKSGIECARGKYVVCVDGDDWVKEDYIESFFNIIKTYSPDLIISEYNIVNSNSIKKYSYNVRYGYYDEKQIKEELFSFIISNKNGKAFAPTIWAKAFKKDIYEKNQKLVNNKISMGEDCACTLLCMFDAKSIFIVNKHTYFYRYNENSMTKRKKAFNLKELHLLYSHYMSNINLNATFFYNQFARKMIHSLFNYSVSQFYLDKKYNEVCKLINEELRKKEFYNLIHFKVTNCSLKLKIAHITLKYKLHFFMYIYSKLK